MAPNSSSRWLGENPAGFLQAEDDEAFAIDQDQPPESEEDQEEEGAGGGFQATKRRLAEGGLGAGGPSQRDTQSVQKLLEEYNKLEYEDIVAGIPTRFRYAKVGIIITPPPPGTSR